MQEESLKDSRDAPGGPNPKYQLAIFTPPFEGMEVQPTELAWAHGKNYVTLSPEPHTKMTELRSLLQEGCHTLRRLPTQRAHRGLPNLDAKKFGSAGICDIAGDNL